MGYETRSGESGINVFCDGVLHKQTISGAQIVVVFFQRNDVPNATIPQAENKPRASNANPSAALLFFEELELDDAADPLAVPCGLVEEGLAVGAGDVPGALTSNSALCAITWVSVVSRNTTL